MRSRVHPRRARQCRRAACDATDAIALALGLDSALTGVGAREGGGIRTPGVATEWVAGRIAAKWLFVDTRSPRRATARRLAAARCVSSGRRSCARSPQADFGRSR